MKMLFTPVFAGASKPAIPIELSLNIVPLEEMRPLILFGLYSVLAMGWLKEEFTTETRAIKEIKWIFMSQ